MCVFFLVGGGGSHLQLHILRTRGEVFGSRNIQGARDQFARVEGP